MKVVIRKYENRRLYDTARSRYVNLDEVAEMIRKGVEVEVVDARSGENLTRVILTQIIVDDARDSDSALPVDLLRQLVVASGRASQQTFARYLNLAFDGYRRAYEAFQARLEQAAPLPLTPLDFMQPFFAPHAKTASEQHPRTTAPSVEDLLRRVEELERRLAESERARAENDTTERR
jgi:polyhydroxyalkanoate synthesis repressor PhaR